MYSFYRIFFVTYPDQELQPPTENPSRMECAAVENRDTQTLKHTAVVTHPALRPPTFGRVRTKGKSISGWKHDHTQKRTGISTFSVSVRNYVHDNSGV